MGGSEDQFIVKATVLLQGCPAPSCPGNGGKHSREDLPHPCLMWWREIGWQLMKWNSSRETADSADIKTKINRFRKNHNLRKKNVLKQTLPTKADGQQPSQIRKSQGGNQEETTDEDGQTANRAKCNFCSVQGVLACHLQERKQCLIAHIEQYLPRRAHLYRGKPKLAIFDLGLACNFCPNPECATDIRGESVTNLKHVKSDCSLFYQSEGQHILKWEPSLSVPTIQTKLRRRKNWIKEGLTEASQIQELSKKTVKIFFDCFHSHHLAMHWYKSIRIGKVRVSSPGSNWKNFFSFTQFEVTAILLPPPNL